MCSCCCKCCDTGTSPELILARKYIAHINKAIELELENIGKSDDNCHASGVKFSENPAGWLKNQCSYQKLFGTSQSSADNEKGWLRDSQLNMIATNMIGLRYVFLVSGIMKMSQLYEEDQLRRERRVNGTTTLSIHNHGENEDDESWEKMINNENNGENISIDIQSNILDLYDEVHHRCHPIWIVTALVTEEHLQHVEDPFRIALKLRAAIRGDYKRSIMFFERPESKMIRQIPRDFAESLLSECVSAEETKHLVDLNDRYVLYDLQAAKFRAVATGSMYNKLYLEEIFWAEPVPKSALRYVGWGGRRFILLISWNILYPIKHLILGCSKLFGRCRTGKRIKRFLELCIKKIGHIVPDDKLFSPISCFIADLVNYLIMILLIAVVMLEKRPSQESTFELARQYLQGNITLDHPRLKASKTDGILLIELEKNPISLVGLTLFFCLISRIGVEIYQLSSKNIWTIDSTPYLDGQRLKRAWKKMQLYFSSDMNKVDIGLMLFLSFAVVIDFHYSADHEIYGKLCTNDEGCEKEYDYTFEARRMVYMTNCYSVALLLSLVRLFYCIFLFVPIIGPILRSIQMMIKDVFKVVMILMFFSVGFFVPLFAMMRCYIEVFGNSKRILQESNKVLTNSTANDEVFGVMDSPGSGFVTMILSIMEGKLTYSDDIYHSEDLSTSVFFSFIMFFYFLIFGLLCLNLLIALISKRYDSMMSNKSRDWRFSQFDLLVDYMSIDVNSDKREKSCNDGMPFFFPFCLIYIPCRLLSRKIKYCNRKCKNKASSKLDPKDKSSSYTKDQRTTTVQNILCRITIKKEEKGGTKRQSGCRPPAPKSSFP